MYTSNQRALYQRKTFTSADHSRRVAMEYAKQYGGGMPPGWVFDAIAEQKLMAGYKRTKKVTTTNPVTGAKTTQRVSNVCQSCYTLKSDNGACLCD